MSPTESGSLRRSRDEIALAVVAIIAAVLLDLVVWMVLIDAPAPGGELGKLSVIVIYPPIVVGTLLGLGAILQIVATRPRGGYALAWIWAIGGSLFTGYFVWGALSAGFPKASPDDFDVPLNYVPGMFGLALAGCLGVLLLLCVRQIRDGRPHGHLGA
jgi:hypothetical protein